MSTGGCNMSAVEIGRFLSSGVVDATATEVERSSLVTLDSESEKQRRLVEWQNVIDQKLIEWGRQPEELADDGIEPPRREVISLAIEFANRMKNEGLPPPDSVVPDPNGGIVFERREGTLSEVLHIWEDGTIEYRQFDSTQLIERRVL